MTDPRAAIVLRLPVSAADMDGLGHLNQARYHDLLGRARGRLLRLPFAESDEVHGTFVVAHVELDYLAEVRATDGAVDVRAAIVVLGGRSVHIENEVIRLDGTVAARGAAVMVAWDRAARRSRDISDAERIAYGAAAPRGRSGPG